MSENPFDMGKQDIGWCPGCGNFLILETFKEALLELGYRPQEIVIVSGIGQAAKLPQYVKTNYVNSLHGRALPIAMGIKAVNPELKVIVVSGDACTYAEGGNHFLHAIRRNINVTHFVHNNMIMGLTKGQASPTTPLGMVTNVQPQGVIVTPLNPIAIAISLNASFVARAFCGDRNETKSIFKKALNHKGYALVDILQPCVIFNHLNTYQWFKKHTYYLTSDHDPSARIAAFQKAIETEKLPLGIFYQTTEKPTFEENLYPYLQNKTPVMKRSRDLTKVAALLDSYRHQ
ncbi:MAG: thiamine pyrophosphate-dependent enzyme [Candidatus Helarchaeota archaeon]